VYRWKELCLNTMHEFITSCATSSFSPAPHWNDIISYDRLGQPLPSTDSLHDMLNFKKLLTNATLDPSKWLSIYL
jgi:hypothetical protein